MAISVNQADMRPPPHQIKHSKSQKNPNRQKKKTPLEKLQNTYLKDIQLMFHKLLPQWIKWLWNLRRQVNYKKTTDKTTKLNINSAQDHYSDWRTRVKYSFLN